MELTKQDTQKAKGVAIIGMVMLHLFCRLDNLPYEPWVWIGDKPLIYFLGLFGDFCVPIYCFCSGYAHYLQKEKYQDNYINVILKKLWRFLCNYWIIVFLFSLLGLVSGNSSEIPKSLFDFIGNVFLFRINYNGAWWFVVTYVILSLVSPLLIKITIKVNSLIVIFISGAIYFVSYLFRFQYAFNLQNEVLDFLWQQTILFGTSQFAYVVGMVCRKDSLISKIRVLVYNNKNKAYSIALKSAVCILPIAAFVFHSIVNSLIIAPLTAATVLLWLFTFKQPKYIEVSLLTMGKHSTNIWFVHMFFYLTLFEGFVFIAKYPLFVFVLMIAICLSVSYLIEGILSVASKLSLKMNVKKSI